MESNGVKGRIHCSEATAAALIAKGKESWLTPREDKGIAKGKGEMQTYFVHPTSSTGRGSVRSGMSGVTESTSDRGQATLTTSLSAPLAAKTDVLLDVDNVDTNNTGIETDIEV